MLLPVPISCITAIIVGHKAKADLKEKIKALSRKAKCRYFEMVIGKTTTTPFLLSINNKSHRFINGRIEPVNFQCKKCHEPIDEQKKTCGWCSISERDIDNAARKNSFRALNRMGGLEEYIASMRAFSEKTR